MSEPILLPQEGEITKALRELLAEIWPLRDRYDALTAAGPTPDSLAARHDANRLDRYALEFARQQWGLCNDNIIAWEAVIKAGLQPHHAHATLLRQALEGAVTARWLMEPGIADETRRLRGVKMERRDQADRAEWERAAGVADKTIVGRAKTGQERLAELKAAATAAGIEWKKMHAIGVRWLFAHYHVIHPRYQWKTRADSPITFDGTTLYQALSGISHNRQWAAAAFSVVEPASPAAGVTDSTNARWSANSYLSLILTGTAMATLAKALEELEKYCSR